MELDKDTYGGLIALAMVSLVFAAMFSMGFSVRTAKAEGTTIYIHADGSVDPLTAPILRVNETYTLTADVSESVVIEMDNIVVDGAGFTVHGVGDVGLDLSNRNNVTVRNFRVMGFLIGISLNSSDNNCIMFNDVRNNTDAGIQLYFSGHNRVLNNLAPNNKYGIRVVNSSHCHFCWNNVTNNWYGIFLNSRPSTTGNFILLENDILNNDVGLWLWNSSDNNIYHNNFFNNSIQVSLHSSYNNQWDNGFEGNYWSDYRGSDVDNDGIGDEPYVIDENNQDKHPLMARITRVKVVKPLPFWFEWWFWGICVLAVTTVVLFGKYAQQRKTIKAYKRQLEIFPEVSHLDRARMLFKADVDRRRRKIEEFGKKYGVRIRRLEDSFEDALERLGIERKAEE